MPSTLVMCLQIMVNPFQSASQYTKRRDDEPMKDPGLAIGFQICHRGKRLHTHARTKKKRTEKVKGGVHKKDQHSSSPEDAAVYLQRHGAR